MKKPTDEEIYVNQYEALIQYLVDGLLVIDREGIVRFANPAAAEMLDKPINDLIGFNLGFPVVSDNMPVEMTLPRSRGEVSIAELRAKQIKWLGEDVILTSLRDVTALKKAQEGLRQQKRFAESLIETAQTIILLLDTEGCIVRFNSYMEELSGYRLHEVVGKDWFSIFIPEHERDSIRTLFLKAIGNTQTRGTVNTILKKDGSEIYVEWHDKTLKDEDGSIIGLLAVGQDITEKLLVEKALRQSEALHKEAQRVAHIGHWQYVPGIGQPKWSEEVFHIFGLDPKQGEPSFAEIKGIIHPDDRHNWQEALRTASTEGAAFDIKFRFRHPAKGLRWLHANGTAEIDADGKVTKVFGTAQDISEVKQALDDLRQSRQFLQNITENMFDMVTMANMEGKFVYANPSHERILGYSPEYLMGRDITEFIHLDDIDNALQKLAEAQETLAPRSAIFRYKTSKGNYIWLETHGKVLLDDEGRPTSMIFSSRDITKNKEAEEEHGRLEAQLHQAQKMESIGRLAGGVAHDFNNLLTAILGFADFIYDALSPQDPIRRDVEEIRKAADSAASLTSQLLAFSRKQIISPQVLNLNSLIDKSGKMLRRIIGEDIELVLATAEDLGQVNIDPSQIDQILVNLAVNARDAMPEGGKLTIETRNIQLDSSQTFISKEDLHGNFVLLAISDSGIGIPPENTQKIFDPFFTTKPKGKGTGLGLSTIYGIIKQNNGYISVYSEPGQGTTFKIYLPRVDSQIEEVAECREAADSAGSETILLVEDQGIVRKTALKALKSKGYKIIEAENGNEALIKFEQMGGEIDLLLTDVVMPYMSGKELYTRLLQINPDLSALFMSGYTDNAIIHHGILAPETNFIQKPFRPQDLVRKVRQVLDSAAAVQEIHVQPPANRNVLLLIDDEEQFHGLLERYAQDLDMILLSALDGEEGLAQLREHGDRIALIISDLNLPDCSGVDLTARIVEIREDIPIVLASGCIPDDLRQMTFARGRVVCREKPVTDPEKWFRGLVAECCREE